MFERLKRLVGLSVIYSISDALGKGAVYLLIPLLTYVLSTDEFGIWAFLRIFFPIGQLIFSVGISQVAFRFYFVYTDDRERRDFFGAIWVFLLLVSSSLLGLTLLVVRLLDVQGFSQIAFYPYIHLTLWAVVVRVAFESIPLQVFRAEENGGAYFAASLATFVLTLATHVGFVWVMGLGLIGALYAALVTSGLMGLYYSVVMLRKSRLNLNFRKFLGPSLAYGLPLIPHTVGFWGLGLADRLVLEANVSLTALGIYSLGDQFRQLYQLLVQGGNAALMPSFGRASNALSERALLPRLSTYYVLAMAYIGLGIAMYAPEVAAIIAPPAYAGAVAVIPWLVLGQFFMAVYFIPMNAIAQTAGQTRQVSVVTVTAAAINIGLNVLLVPRYGIMAAAVSTTIGYVVLFAFMQWQAQRIMPIAHQTGRLLRIVVVALAVYGLAQFVAVETLVFSIIVKSVVLLLFLPGLWLSGFLLPEEQAMLRQGVERLTSTRNS